MGTQFVRGFDSHTGHNGNVTALPHSGKVKHMSAVETIRVDRNGREYTIEVHVDEDAGNPMDEFDTPVTLAVMGGRDYIDAEYGELADEVMAALKSGYSNTAIARWLRLKGATGIHLVYRGGNYGTINTRPIEESIDDRGHTINTWTGAGAIYRTEGFAFLAPGVADREYTALGFEDMSDNLVKGTVDTYAAWAEGSVYGWVVEGPNGESIESCWGYYGWDNDESGLMAAATEAIDGHEHELAKQAGAYTAGFVGVI